MYVEDDLLPISALQHLLFCERQCALIHVERMWAENRFTVEGQLLHRKAHEVQPETRDGIRITRGLPLQNFELGLCGQADVIEWEVPSSQLRPGMTLAKVLANGSCEERLSWRVVPVEYKRGKPKSNDCDRVQLCAQALCLEEMLGIEVKEGALYYGRNRRRTSVEIGRTLRQLTIDSAKRLHEILDNNITPPAVYEAKCETCSLKDLCLPKANSHKSVSAWLAAQLE